MYYLLLGDAKIQELWVRVNTVDYLGEQIEISDNCIPMNEASFSDIAYSAAAFAPEQNNLFIPKHKSKSSKSNGLYDRLSRMSNELDEVL